MNNRSSELEAFFDAYAARFNDALSGGQVDPEEAAAAFAECFVESSPVGVICGQNDKEFRKKIPEGYDFYKSIGVTSMDIESREITVLDAFHALCKVHWKTNFTRKDGSGGNITFDVIYFVRTENDVHRIFAYITGDEQQALKDNGLI